MVLFIIMIGSSFLCLDGSVRTYFYYLNVYKHCYSYEVCEACIDISSKIYKYIFKCIFSAKSYIVKILLHEIRDKKP